MSDPPRRGRPMGQLAAEREELIYCALDQPYTSRRVSEMLGIEISIVRLLLRGLRRKGILNLQKVDGEFVWSRTHQ